MKRSEKSKASSRQDKSRANSRQDKSRANSRQDKSRANGRQDKSRANSRQNKSSANGRQREPEDWEPRRGEVRGETQYKVKLQPASPRCPAEAIRTGAWRRDPDHPNNFNEETVG